MASDIKFRCYAGGSKITVTVRFSFSYILSWSKTTGTGSKLSKGQNRVVTGNYFPWNTDCACSLLKLFLPPSLKRALGRWVKDVLKIRDRLPQRKLRRSNFIAQSTMRGGHVYCICEKAIYSFNIDFTCAHGGGNNCKRHVESIRPKDYKSEEIPAVLFKVSGSKARWRPAGHH